MLLINYLNCFHHLILTLFHIPSNFILYYLKNSIFNMLIVTLVHYNNFLIIIFILLYIYFNIHSIVPFILKCLYNISNILENFYINFGYYSFVSIK